VLVCTWAVCIWSEILGELLVENPPPEAALATAVVVVLPLVVPTLELPLPDEELPHPLVVTALFVGLATLLIAVLIV
jgi:hypothetical protein